MNILDTKNKKKQSNMTYLEKIKAINSITLSKICKEEKVNRSNLLNGRTTKEKEKQVYMKFVGEILEIIKKG